MGSWTDGAAISGGSRVARYSREDGRSKVSFRYGAAHWSASKPIKVWAIFLAGDDAHRCQDHLAIAREQKEMPAQEMDQSAVLGGKYPLDESYPVLVGSFP